MSTFTIELVPGHCYADIDPKKGPIRFRYGTGSDQPGMGIPIGKTGQLWPAMCAFLQLHLKHHPEDKEPKP